VAEVVLTVDVEEGLEFGAEAPAGKHLGSIEGLAHGYFFKMFDIGMKKELIVVGREDGSTKVLYFDHFARYL
jgi:hypothetical protein